MSPIALLEHVAGRLVTATTIISKRDGEGTPSAGQVLAEQWRNPVDISTVLLVIGSDVIQKAFAQGAGKPYVPVCFSFGCVAYQFQALVNVLGDGRLLPPPDYPCKVFNLGSGYARESKNFVISRLLRDLEAQEMREAHRKRATKFSLRITVLEADWTNRGPTTFPWTYLHLVGLMVTAFQFAIAAAPYIVGGDWSVLLITAAGTLFVQCAGVLPQWTAEKLPTRQKSTSIFALTSGNGSQDIFVIVGDGKCIDLESLATSQTPRNSRPWEKFRFLFHTTLWWPFHSLPLGFIITRVSSSILSVLWLLLLITISAPKTYPASWCLLLIGGLGMFQNAWLAAKELSPDMRNIPLRKVDQITSRKVMDGIMDFQSTYGMGIPLLKEYFPGDLRPAEQKWWAGDCAEYEDARSKDKTRGEPRRLNPEKYKRFSYPAAKMEGLASGIHAGPQRGKSGVHYQFPSPATPPVRRAMHSSTLDSVAEDADNAMGWHLPQAASRGEEEKRFSSSASPQKRHSGSSVTSTFSVAAWAT